MFAVDACNGETAVLTGSAGEFGTVGDQYNNDETCQWMVQVEVGKVGIDKNIRWRILYSFPLGLK